MSDAMAIVEAMCQRYQSAVNANDSTVYRRLFAEDAIRIPPGSEPERGPKKIGDSEQRDYDVARWTIQSTPIDGLAIGDDWIYGIAHVDVTTVAHDDGAVGSFQATKTWLLHRESDEWLIYRQMWNLK